MSYNVQDIVRRLYEGEDTRTVISEALTLKYHDIVDELEKDAEVEKYLKDKDLQGLIHYIRKISKDFDYRLSYRHIRNIGRELMNRYLAREGGR